MFGCWIGMYQYYVEMVIIFIGDQVGWKIVLCRLFFCYFYQLIFMDGVYVVDVIFKCWFVVEDVDIVVVMKIFFFQYCVGRCGLWMYLIDDVLGFLG